MTEQLVVRCHADVTMTTRGELSHLCPHVDERDRGFVEITWRAGGQTFELHALADYLRSWKDSTISHEEITDRIRHDLSAHSDIDLVSVDTTWRTAGMEVRCFTSPTPAVTP